jgi:hypothetical protein
MTTVIFMDEMGGIDVCQGFPRIAFVGVTAPANKVKETTVNWFGIKDQHFPNWILVFLTVWDAGEIAHPPFKVPHANPLFTPVLEHLLPLVWLEAGHVPIQLVADKNERRLGCIAFGVCKAEFRSEVIEMASRTAAVVGVVAGWGGCSVIGRG